MYCAALYRCIAQGSSNNILTLLPHTISYIVSLYCCSATMTVTSSNVHELPKQEEVIVEKDVQRPKLQRIQFYKGTFSSPFAMEVIAKMVYTPSNKSLSFTPTTHNHTSPISTSSTPTLTILLYPLAYLLKRVSYQYLNTQHKNGQ